MQKKCKKDIQRGNAIEIQHLQGSPRARPVPLGWRCRARLLVFVCLIFCLKKCFVKGALFKGLMAQNVIKQKYLKKQACSDVFVIIKKNEKKNYID